MSERSIIHELFFLQSLHSTYITGIKIAVIVTVVAMDMDVVLLSIDRLYSDKKEEKQDFHFLLKKAMCLTNK